MNEKKRVELTWDRGGRFVKEVCWLLPDDAPLFYVDGEQLDEQTVHEVKCDGFVHFEDDEGFFLLHSSQIFNITVL